MLSVLTEDQFEICRGEALFSLWEYCKSNVRPTGENMDHSDRRSLRNNICTLKNYHAFGCILLFAFLSC